MRNNSIFVIVATLEEGDRTVPRWCRSLDRAGPDLGAAGCTGSLPYTNVQLYSALLTLYNGKLNLKAWTFNCKQLNVLLRFTGVILGENVEINVSFLSFKFYISILII